MIDLFDPKIGWLEGGVQSSSTTRIKSLSCPVRGSVAEGKTSMADSASLPSKRTKPLDSVHGTAAPTRIASGVHDRASRTNRTAAYGRRSEYISRPNGVLEEDCIMVGGKDGLDFRARL